MAVDLPVSASQQLTHPKYRPDIDGLRAIAVLAVVGFHAFPSLLKGGFIGVDIFFVISGYLISTIIFGSLERNSFSFRGFYARRIKRIFPALLAVLMASFAFGWFALLPDEYKQLGKHIAGGAGFVSNFIFWNESGYFDNASESKPLLHLWSLGIEEQFYIVWPLLLWFAWKKKLNLLTLTIVIGLISFALNLGRVRSDAIAAFYSPQTRFWELLAGSVLAYIALYKPNPFAGFKRKLAGWSGAAIHAGQPDANRKLLRNVQSLAGALLLAIGIALITKNRHFPGGWAILPTLGTVLIIAAGTQAWLNRAILSNRVLVWFGLISFPLYLWHWPLLSFARILESETPASEVRLAAVAMSIVLAWLTYALIEKPIRFGGHHKLKTGILVGLMMALGYTGYNSYQRDGLAFRTGMMRINNDGDIGHEIFFKQLYDQFYLCTPIDLRKEALTGLGSTRCLQSEQQQAKKIALIGDSHAEHLFLGLAEELKGSNVVYYIKDYLPVIGNQEFQNIFNSVIHDPNIKTVILSAYWHARMSQIPKGSSFKSELVKTVNALTAANKTVYLADDVPSFSFDPKKCKYSRWAGQKSNCLEDNKIFYSKYQNYYPIFQSIEAGNKDAKILKTAEYFCGKDFCTMAENGVLFYRDQHHLNLNGSRYLGKKIVADHPRLSD